MVDIHCHILPGLDDGARNLADSVAMARQACADGIEIVCATPHIRADHDVHIGELRERVSALQHELAREQLDVQILPGGELAASAADGLTDQQLRQVWLGGRSGWVLLEPAPGPLDDRLEACVARLARRGVHTVVAHPERHAGADFVARLRVLAERGCLIQWTAQFVADAADGDLALELAAGGLVHLLGSDAHSSLGGRPVRLSEGFARLRTVCSPERLRWIEVSAPRAVALGEPLTPLP